MSISKELFGLNKEPHTENCYANPVNNSYLRCTCGADSVNSIIDSIDQHELSEEAMAKIIFDNCHSISPSELNTIVEALKSNQSKLFVRKSK